jgi:Cys/Met metabolism PLP-dependent enzyme
MPNRCRAPHSAIAKEQISELDAMQGRASPKVKPDSRPRLETESPTRRSRRRWRPRAPKTPSQSAQPRGKTPDRHGTVTTAASPFAEPEAPVFPIKEVADIGRSLGVPLIVDNTAVPLIGRPFDHGTAVVVYSATKYTAVTALLSAA